MVRFGLGEGLTAGVVTGDDGLVLSHAVCVGLNDSAQESVVEVGQIVTVAVAGSCHTAVYACRITVPKVHVDSRDRLASAGANGLNVKVERDTFLAVRDVAPNELAIDVVRALGELGLRSACRVVLEQ